MNIPFGIVNFRKGGCEHFIFFGNGIPTEPLLKRPFFFGVFDCFSLAQDYIEIKFGKRIPGTPRNVDYFRKGVSHFEDHIMDKDYPINFIDLKDTKEHDFLFYKHESNIINHVGIILNGRILHHFINRLSCRLPVSFFNKYIYAAGRYDRDWEGSYEPR